jgi:hypothetical protein
MSVIMARKACILYNRKSNCSINHRTENKTTNSGTYIKNLKNKTTNIVKKFPTTTNTEYIILNKKKHTCDDDSNNININVITYTEYIQNKASTVLKKNDICNTSNNNNYITKTYNCI